MSDRRSPHDFAQGVRVRVLPGRNFPAFKADDVGTVAKVDAESRTCDVIFGEALTPVPVALRHLDMDTSSVSGQADVSIVQDSAGPKALARSLQRESLTSHSLACHSDRSAVMEPSNCRTSNHALAQRLAVLEGKADVQQSQCEDLASRVAACETCIAPRWSAAPSSVLEQEKAHRAELVQLKRQVQDACALNQESECRKRLRRPNDTGDLKRNSAEFCDIAQVFEDRLQHSSAALEAQERRASCLDDVVAAASSGLIKLSELLENQERRTAGLGQSIGVASDDVQSLRRDLDAQAVRVTDMGRQAAALTSGVTYVGRSCGLEQDAETVWKALRELQEKLVDESEHRAAGMREVMCMIERNVDHLREQHSKFVFEADARSESVGKLTSQQFQLCASRQDVLEKRTDDLSLQLRSIMQELHLRTKVGSVSPASPPLADIAATELLPQGTSDLWVDGNDAASAPAPPRDVKRSMPLANENAMSYVAQSPSSTMTATEDTLGRLRGQLEGLRSELLATCAAEAVDAAGTDGSTIQHSSKLADPLPEGPPMARWNSQPTMGAVRDASPVPSHGSGLLCENSLEGPYFAGFSVAIPACSSSGTSSRAATPRTIRTGPAKVFADPSCIDVQSTGVSYVGDASPSPSLTKTARFGSEPAFGVGVEQTPLIHSGGTNFSDGPTAPSRPQQLLCQPRTHALYSTVGTDVRI